MSSVLLGLFTFIPTLATVTVAILNNFVPSPDFARQIINVMTPKLNMTDRRFQHKNNETAHSVSAIRLLDLK